MGNPSDAEIVRMYRTLRNTKTTPEQLYDAMWSVLKRLMRHIDRKVTSAPNMVRVYDEFHCTVRPFCPVIYLTRDGQFWVYERASQRQRKCEWNEVPQLMAVPNHTAAVQLILEAFRAEIEKQVPELLAKANQLGGIAAQLGFIAKVV